MDVESLTEALSVISENHLQLDPSLWASAAKYTNRTERVRLIYRKFNGEIKAL